MDKEQVEWAKEATDIEGNVQQKDMAGNQSAPRVRRLLDLADLTF